LHFADCTRPARSRHSPALCRNLHFEADLLNRVNFPCVRSALPVSRRARPPRQKEPAAKKLVIARVFRLSSFYHTIERRFFLRDAEGKKYLSHTQHQLMLLSHEYRSKKLKKFIAAKFTYFVFSWIIFVRITEK
jgi:hypothetical protein